MNIYLTPPQPSRGLQRIADALTRYLPEGWTTTTELLTADLIIIYVIGRHDAVLRLVYELMRRKQRYAIIQCCLRSTMRPDTSAWRFIWDNAAVVWSYYDLDAAIAADGGTGTAGNFYHAPLGADAEVFQPRKLMMTADGDVYFKRDYVIATSGLSRLSESTRECAIAAQHVDGSVFHVGPDIGLLGHVVYSDERLTDYELSQCYSGCQFVSALRRTEGFELPAVEGLLCGARPICFDTPDYHWCYGDHADYVREGTRAEVVEQLVTLFKRGARGVTEEERADAVERFNWETIVGGFYERLSLKGGGTQ